MSDIDEYEYISESEEESEDQSWVEWFCSLKGHEFFCEVERSFIEDEFNLIDLQNKVPDFENSMKEILDIYDDGFQYFFCVFLLFYISFRI